MADAHVVRHEIKNEAHVGARQRCGEPRESFLAAKLGIEHVVVDDVVAVRRAGACLQERRRVEMADAERLQIRHDRGGFVEAELRRKL